MDKSLPKRIWLAGLGAISRAEREGDEWLSELMAEGEIFEREKKAEIDHALMHMTEKLKGGQGRVKQKLGDIESTFESKVSKTLRKVGLVSKKELSALKVRIDELERNLDKT